jgi:hypothetical protein
MSTPEQVTAAAVQSAINQRVEQAVNAAMQQMQLHLQQQQAPIPPQQQPNIQVNAVAVKLPDFWAADPTTWFRQAEAAFRRSNITVSSTMYDHVLMKLPQDVVMSVRDLVNSVEPTTPDPYEQLKARLTDCYAKTRWQQCFALLDLPPLGDRRPSHLMNEMLALLPTGSNRGSFDGVLDSVFWGWSAGPVADNGGCHMAECRGEARLCRRVRRRRHERTERVRFQNLSGGGVNQKPVGGQKIHAENWLGDGSENEAAQEGAETKRE